ncbi:hypothetical protein K2173_006999 [Erythroxylum novogranatense]|uniref:F-box protein n=1 Tax=Erythroxylum novogranatense TaxID=1862640 RepID=A0AAV8SY92_9ROSI|nr:hypothetical protein K2173_006999 [Erythroxylum novogranatense]
MSVRVKTATIDSIQAGFCSDDILCEILIRLPPESVFRLILVSKRWLHFICSPSYRHNYTRKWRLKFSLLGFFTCNTLYLGRPRDGLRRPPSEPALSLLSTSKEGDEIKFSGILKELGYFIDSKNGLILCGRHPKTYFLWNPFTKQHYKLPRPRVYFDELCMAFLVEDHADEIMCYKVIRAKCERRLDEVKTIAIETFNPKTSTWYFSILHCSSTLSLCPWKVATVIKCVVYWFAEHGKIAIYDSGDEGKQIALLKLPGSNDFDEQVLGESFDGLLQYGWSCKSGLEIWVFEREPSECTSSNVYETNRWNRRYRLNFKIMWKMNPSVAATLHTGKKETQILSFIPQNTESVFIRTGSDIFVCDLVSQTVEVVRYQGRTPPILWDHIHSRVVPYFSPAWPTLPSRQSSVIMI